MTRISAEKCKNMVLGALVADAAAVGLHWIYDQDHIRKVAPQDPEFRTPDADNYEGVVAFFAHPHAQVGALSQYGEQAMVMLRSLAATDGVFSPADYLDRFRAHFGYGGTFTGYIDHATRDTLDNLRRFEDAAHACATALCPDATPRLVSGMVTKALPLLARHSGADLSRNYEQALRLDHEDEAVIAQGMRVLDALTALPPPTGAADLQLPAIAKLAPLVAVMAARAQTDGPEFSSAIAAAVATTNDHPVAATYGQICARMMAAAVTGATAQGAIDAGRAGAPSEAKALLDEALARQAQDTNTITKHFGMACDLPYGVPSAAHNIATAPTFRDAIQRNIYAGGDSCGRAMLVGAVMGAIHGVPQDWTDTLAQRNEVETLLARLLD